MKAKLSKDELKQIKDFKAGEFYSAEGVDYKVLEVTPTHVICKLNARIVKFAKILYCGVYAAMYFGKPLFLSDKIIRATEN